MPGQWSAVEAGTLSLIKNLPNYNDDGSLNTRSPIVRSPAFWSPAPPPTPSSMSPRAIRASGIRRSQSRHQLGHPVQAHLGRHQLDQGRPDPWAAAVGGEPFAQRHGAERRRHQALPGAGRQHQQRRAFDFFSNAPEYALTAAMLEIDLVALEAIPNKAFTYAPGVAST